VAQETHVPLSSTVEWCTHGFHAFWRCCMHVLLLVTLLLPSRYSSCDTLVTTAVEAWRVSIWHRKHMCRCPALLSGAHIVCMCRGVAACVFCARHPPVNLWCCSFAATTVISETQRCCCCCLLRRHGAVLLQHNWLKHTQTDQQ
jgi:hypothetical protein